MEETKPMLANRPSDRLRVESKRDNQQKSDERTKKPNKHSRKKRGRTEREHNRRRRASGELLAVPSDHSDDSSSEISEEISVLETPENQSYERKVTIGLLSRAGYREHYWRNKISSYFFILSFLMTYDTVALFFHSTHEYGIFFIVNFGICMMLIGFPMCYLEMALGQYTSTGIFLVFDRMAPGFVGVAISALTLNFLHMCTHHDAFIDIFSIAAQSGVITSSQKPWKHCLDPSATKQCYTWPRNCDDMEYTNDIPQYPKHLAFESITYSKLMLIGDACARPSLLSIYQAANRRFSSFTFQSFMTTPLMNYLYDEIDDFNTWQKLKYPSSTYLLLTMTVALFLIHILTRTKKALLIILNSALVITFCVLLFILHSTLTFFTPKRPYAVPITIGMSKALFNWEAWRSAVALTFRALNLGQGAWTFFGSLFGFHNNLQLDCLLLTVFMIFLPFFYSLIHTIIIDSYLLERVGGNYMDAAKILNMRLSNFYSDPFTVVSSFLDSLHIFGDYEPMMTFAYSLAQSITLLSNKIVRLEILISAITEMNVTFSSQSSHNVVVILVVLFGTVCQMFALYENGHYRLITIKRAVLPIAAIAVVLLELFVIGIFYGFRVFFSNTSLMLFGAMKAGSKKGKLAINSMMLVLWAVVIPVLAIFCLARMISAFAATKITTIDYYNWAIIFGILLPIPAMLIRRMNALYVVGYSFKSLFKRNPDLWGPRLRANRVEAERAERMIRKWW